MAMMHGVASQFSGSDTSDGDALGQELAELILGLGDFDAATHAGLNKWLDCAVSDLGKRLRQHNIGAAFVASQQARLRRTFWERINHVMQVRVIRPTTVGILGADNDYRG